MPIRKREIERLSEDLRLIIDGQAIDLRDNREGALSILKNDIHSLASLKDEQVKALARDRDALKDTLANISHQLKTPLTSLNIMADIVENAPDEKRAEFMQNIRSELARMEWLVSSLLKFAKLDAGAIEFARERVSSQRLIEYALEPLSILFDVKNQTVEQKGSAEFVCDSRWTAEALTNILKNASEHSPEGGVIRIEAGTNPICKWIKITDSGKGLAKNEIAGLFRRFEVSCGAGYGIGLPLALAIIRGQSGDIEVSGGGEGIGAAFTLKFYL